MHLFAPFLNASTFLHFYINASTFCTFLNLFCLLAALVGNDVCYAKAIFIGE
ncbi:hypothetical protein L9F63_007025, partial [Diploptera punctata]